MIGLLFLSACFPPAPGSLPPDPLDGEPPAITAVSWQCDPEQGRWTFAISTDAWTGGGMTWMARDTDYHEAHRIRSVEAAADGSGDLLELELNIVADWRDAVSGSSTAWRCMDASALSFQVAVSETSGEAQTDCRTWGDQPTLWDDIPDVEPCATVLEITDTGMGMR